MTDTMGLVRAAIPASQSKRRAILNARRNPAAAMGAAILILVILCTVSASQLTRFDPIAIDPMMRLKPPSLDHIMGTDVVGRDIWSRTLYGGRVSLLVGLIVSVLTTLIGLMIGLISGYNRTADAILMRFMDGLMSIPSILLAIALMAFLPASVMTVVVAISVVETPRVVRLVRGVVLSLRDQPFVEAAVVVGSKFPRILLRHILPNTLAPLSVQATYVCAAAILVESLLSFLGAGTPPEVPSWGNIMAEGHIYFVLAPWIILAPGLMLSLTVLAINLLGDGLRETLDPRFARAL
jgi:peptide/nickel transport system permease protein